MSSSTHLVIPMSGLGKRFVEAGYSVPKPLIVVDGKPMIQHVVELFPGVDKTTFIVNDKHMQETNMQEILHGISPSAKIIEVGVGSKKGPVDVVLSAQNEITDDEEVIVSYCDYGTKWNYKSFLQDARTSNADGSIACYRGFHPHMLGKDNYAFAKERNKILLEIKEKEPFTNDKMSEYASNGTYYFKNGAILKKYFQKMLRNGKSINNEYYVSLVYNFLIEDSLRVNIFEIEKMLQWGTPYDLETYNSWSRYFSEKSNVPIKAKNPPKTTMLMPAAGKGNRFFEQNYDLPKPMLEVDSSPMIVGAAKCLPQSESHVFVCLKDHIENHKIDNVLKKEYPNCNIVSLQGTTNGQACTCEIAIKEARLNPDDPILISACDNGIVFDENEYENLLNDASNDVIVFSFRNNPTSKINPNAYAWLDVAEDGTIKHVSCKKFIYNDPLKTHAITGTMFFRKAKYFLDGLVKNYEEKIMTNGEYYVDDVINQNIKSGLKVKVFETKNYICWGTPNDYKTYLYWQEYFCGDEN